MTPDQIFITDVGPDRRESAFYWLALGRHIHDYLFNKITLRDLEREIDPNDVMNPVILRAHLWKTVPSRLWQVDDGHQLGPMPSQPGLDTYSSSGWMPEVPGSALANCCPGVYYADRRARQRPAGRQRSPQVVHTVSASQQPTFIKNDSSSITEWYAEAHSEIRRRRTRSMGVPATEHHIARECVLSRRRSINDLITLTDDETDELDCGDTAEDIVEPEWRFNPSVSEDSSFGRLRKVSTGEDSGVDMGNCEQPF